MFSYTNTTVMPVDASEEEALALVRDGKRVMSLRGNMHSIVDKGPDHFEVVEMLNLLGRNVELSRIDVRWAQREGGAETHVQAAMGVRVHNVWTVQTVNGQTSITEQATVTAPWWLAPLWPFVVGQFTGSRKSMPEEFRNAFTSKSQSVDER